jgi:hypothetical protein
MLVTICVSMLTHFSPPRLGSSWVALAAVALTAACGSVNADNPDAAASIDAAPTADAATAIDAAIDAGADASTDGGVELAPVPAGCVRATTDRSTFLLCGNPSNLNWAQADARCQEHGKRLARIDDAEENTLLRFLGAHVEDGGAANSYGIMIGATDEEVEGTWRWLYGDPTVFWIGEANGTPQNGLYSNWASGEPNDYVEDGEDYGVLVTEGERAGRWNDVDDRARPAYACGKHSADASIASHCYRLQSPTTTYLVCRQPGGGTSYSWPGARQQCQSVGMDLATIESAAEQGLLHAAAQGWEILPRCALGGSDEAVEGTWVWVSTGVTFFNQGAPVGGAYVNWAPGEPNNQGGQDYLSMREDGQWDDIGELILGGWICQQFE